MTIQNILIWFQASLYISCGVVESGRYSGEIGCVYQDPIRPGKLGFTMNYVRPLSGSHFTLLHLSNEFLESAQIIELISETTFIRHIFTIKAIEKIVGQSGA